MRIHNTGAGRRRAYDHRLADAQHAVGGTTPLLLTPTDTFQNKELRCLPHGPQRSPHITNFLILSLLHDNRTIFSLLFDQAKERK